MSKSIYSDQEKHDASSLPAWLLSPAKFSWNHVREEREALTLDDQMNMERDKLGMNRYNVNETPDLIATSFREFDDALDSIKEKEAYETALFIDPEYVESEEFRLAFLRADLFNIPAAARRMVKYWERKIELFGPEKAFGRYLSLLDLKEEDYSSLVLGAVRLLPQSDDAGRSLIFKQMRYFSRSVYTMHRLEWYMVHAAVFGGENSEQTQKNGFVNLGILNHPNGNAFDSFSEARRYIQGLKHDTESALPMRGPLALHFFTDNNWFITSLVERILDILKRDLRLRLTMYDFSEEETEANLIDLGICGIQRESVPAVIGGYMDDNMQAFLSGRLKKELTIAGFDFKANPGWEKQLPVGLQTLLNLS